MPPVNPAGSSGYIVRPEEFPLPEHLTPEALEAAALRVPADPAALDAAADAIIREINGDAEKAAGVPSGTIPEPKGDDESGDDIP